MLGLTTLAFDFGCSVMIKLLSRGEEKGLSIKGWRKITTQWKGIVFCRDQKIGKNTQGKKKDGCNQAI